MISVKESEEIKTSIDVVVFLEKERLIREFNDFDKIRISPVTDKVVTYDGGEVLDTIIISYALDSDNELVYHVDIIED